MNYHYYATIYPQDITQQNVNEKGLHSLNADQMERKNESDMFIHYMKQLSITRNQSVELMLIWIY
jgi:hypothetical protein